MPALPEIGARADALRAVFEDLHAHPEIGFQEVRTSGIVAKALRDAGVDEVHEGIGGTGVVGIIRGKGGGNRRIGLRADMDALPLTEITGLDYASKTPGKMHACGHDGHTSMLLGAAKYLAETRNFNGTAVMIFQPAEEGGAGAKAMLDDGLADRWDIDEFYGMHNMPGMPVGSFAIRSGAMMAAADQVIIKVTGRGGHGAQPHETIDPMLTAAHIITALQSIVSRNVDPLKSGVISATMVRSDAGAHNVIPQVVEIEGTVRSLDPEIRDLLEAGIKRVATHVAAGFGATAEVDYQRGYPVTINHAEATEHAAAAARSIAGDIITDIEPEMGAEDFSYMLESRPGAYIWLGNGDTAGLHHPAYNFDDEAIPAGSSWYATMIEQRMPA